jgi:hypothetical protein
MIEYSVNAGQYKLILKNADISIKWLFRDNCRIGYAHLFFCMSAKMAVRHIPVITVILAAFSVILTL